ncbi:MAG TPA: hypothetical protein VJB59_06790 [Bdellovibrionota bacterium]|nr:hypothetical protein [Bdellovibrionota bacterium]
MKKKRNPSKSKIAFEKKVREYRKFLKDDYDWDWHFIIRMLRYKLERTRRCILDNNIIADAKKVGKEIDEVVRLLKRIEDDPYFKEIRKPFYKKYGYPKMVFGKRIKGRNSVEATVVYPRENPRNREQIARESLRLSKLEDELRRKDLKRAFDLMLKNIWGWWD